MFGNDWIKIFESKREEVPKSKKRILPKTRNFGGQHDVQ